MSRNQREGRYAGRAGHVGDRRGRHHVRLSLDPMMPWLGAEWLFTHRRPTKVVAWTILLNRDMAAIGTRLVELPYAG